MAVRLVHVLLISLLLYEFASGDYCRNENISSIPFCQSGTISGLKVYINGSNVQTKEDLIDRGCVCYLQQVGNNEIYVDAMESCNYCGLQVLVGTFILRSDFYNGQSHGWGSTVLNDTKFAMILGLDEKTGSLNTAFCIGVQTIHLDTPSVLTLTCEGIDTRSSTTSSASPNMVPDTAKSRSPTSDETAISVPNTETTNSAVVSAGTTNATHGPKANTTDTLTTTTTTITTTTTTTGNIAGEPRLHTQKEVIIPAAAGGGAGVLVILVIVIVVCCLRKKRKHAEDPICMKEPERSDAIMTDNVAYGIYIDTNTNPVPHVQAHCTGDVYAVVNKEGTSNVFPSVEVPRMQVGETGDVYAIVNKRTVRDTPNIEHSRDKSTKSRIQTKCDNNNVTVDITPSTDYADITIDNSCV